MPTITGPQAYRYLRDTRGRWDGDWAVQNIRNSEMQRERLGGLRLIAGVVFIAVLVGCALVIVAIIQLANALQ